MSGNLSPSRERLEHNHTREEIRQRLAQAPRGNYLRDWIYGGIDGTITTFAIVAGVVGADAYSPNAPAAVTFANRLPATGGANAVVPG